MNYADLLAVIKTQCALIPGIKTCKVGLEAELTPDDYPIVRLVPSRLVPAESGTRSTLELLIYYGSPLLPFDGLEAVYAELFRLEACIYEAVMFGAVNASNALGSTVRVEYLETVTDEDRLPAYKLFASRYQLVS